MLRWSMLTAIVVGSLVCWVSLHLTQPTALWAQDKDALQLLVVTGGHAYKTAFYTVFQNKPDWEWDHEYPAAHAYRRDLRQRYDAILMYDMAVSDIGDKARQNLRVYLESGKGVVVLHHAILNRGYGDWWYRDVVGGLYLRDPIPEKSTPSTFLHDVEFTVRPVMTHPITQGLGAIRIYDETYKDMWISGDVTVLMETDHATSDGPVVWVCPYEKARVVYIQLGHGPEAHVNPQFQELVRRAVLWTAGRLP